MMPTALPGVLAPFSIFLVYFYTTHKQQPLDNVPCATLLIAHEKFGIFNQIVLMHKLFKDEFILKQTYHKALHLLL